MKIPTFDVGTANLRGDNQNLYVNMDGIKFFRFQNEANPRIWATGTAGTTNTGGTLTRTETRTLPGGATLSPTVTITEMRGGAAGTIKPGVNTTGLPGSNSFGGTAAGTVR